jgi:16S rRNA (guanine966-N2)-methyltransferase
MKRDVKTSSKASGAIRIISGRFRGRKLPVIDVQGLRPTTDKNKETLFNWLMAYTRDARCLDCFAGSGGLGFEALSRYAKSCTFIELDKKAANKLTDNTKLLGLSESEVQIVNSSALHHLTQDHQPYDLIFLDPPFNQDFLPKVIHLIAEGELLAANGMIYIECEGQGIGYAVPENWKLLKERRNAQILARVYQCLL